MTEKSSPDVVGEVDKQWGKCPEMLNDFTHAWFSILGEMALYRLLFVCLFVCLFVWESERDSKHWEGEG